MAHFRVTDSCLSLWSCAHLRAAASPSPCWVPAPALKALRATTGAVSPQPGQNSPRGRDCSTPSGASGQWWCRRWAHAPVGNVQELSVPLLWSHPFTIESFLDGFPAHARVSAPKGATQTATSSSWGSPWLVAACPLSHWCPDMKDSELQGYQCWPRAKRLWAGNPQLCSLLAIHRSPNSQCVFKVLGRLSPVCLKACLKFYLVRLSLKRTTVSFKSKFLSLWSIEVPWGLVWDWGMHIYKSKLLLQTSPPAVLSDVSVVLILFFFF